MRRAKVIPEDNSRAEPGGRAWPPKYVEPEENLVAYPHCNRKFAENAAERHIPICERVQKGRGERW
jgi:hypothetical protein